METTALIILYLIISISATLVIGLYVKQAILQKLENTKPTFLDLSAREIYKGIHDGIYQRGKLLLPHGAVIFPLNDVFVKGDAMQIYYGSGKWITLSQTDHSSPLTNCKNNQGEFCKLEVM